MFEPGQLLECVDDGARDGVKVLARGRIYTVAVSSGSLLLIEEHGPPAPFIAFRASRFRAVPEQQIARFRALLEPSREETRERVR